MITAIDTNILLAILVPNEKFFEASARALQDAATEGSLAVSDIVYAELCKFSVNVRYCDQAEGSFHGPRGCHFNSV